MSVVFNMPGICQQRKRQATYHIPPVRRDMLSPYTSNPSITQMQLSMRRKVEILQYAGNRSNTKTNALTKTQKWAMVVSGKYKTPSAITKHYFITDINGQIFDIIVEYPDVLQMTPTTIIDASAVLIDGYSGYYHYNIQNNTTLCDSLPTLTSSCDVPGPVMYLVRDDAIPLYQYTAGNNTNAIIQKEDTFNWHLFPNVDSVIPNTIASLMISKMASDTYNFTIKVPIAVYVSEKITSAGIGHVYNITKTFNLNSLLLSVYYNNNIVSGGENYVYRYDNKSFDYNISFTGSEVKNGYYFTRYMGVVTISNIILDTNEGNVYDFNVSSSVTITGGETTEVYFKSDEIKYGVIGNISNPERIAAPINCSLGTLNNANQSDNGIVLT